MKLADLLFLEKHLTKNVAACYQIVFLVNIYTYTSIIILVNQLTEGFQTWKNQRKESGVQPLLFLKILVKTGPKFTARRNALLLSFFLVITFAFVAQATKLTKHQRENSSNPPLYTSTEYYYHGSDIPN